ELIDLDGASAFDLQSLKFFILNDEVLPFSDLIAASGVLSGDNLTGFRVNVLLFQTISGFPVNPIKTHLFAERRRWIKSNGTGHQRKPKEALPICTRGHSILVHTRTIK